MEGVSDVAKDRGYFAEMLFAVEAVKRGYTVLSPGGDNCPFDAVLLSPSGKFTKVQVKSCLKREPNRNRFTFSTKCGGSQATYRAYETHEIDVMALYAFETGAWYFIPISEVGGAKTIKISSGCKFDKFFNLWSIFE